MASKLNFIPRVAGSGNPAADVNLIAPTIDAIEDDVSARVLLTDVRLSDARTPLPHTQLAATITDLAPVATSGAYTDLSAKPVIPPDLSNQVNANTSAITAKVDKAVGFALSSNDYTSAEKTKLTGIAPGATANSTDAQLLASAASSAAYANKAASTLTGLANVATSGSYTDLSSQPTIPAAYTDNQAQNAVAPALSLKAATTYVDNQNLIISNQLAAKVDKANGFALSSNDYTGNEKTKLAGIAPGATANSTDAYLLARINQTGIQPASTITGLAPVATSGAYADLTGQPTGTSYTDAQAQNAVAPALSLKAATTYVDQQDNSIIATVANKVDKASGFALSSNDYTSAEQTKLAGIAVAATYNSSDAQLRDRTTHTGVQPASTVTGLSSVATSGAYTDLSGKPTIPAAYTDAQAQNAVAPALSLKAATSYVDQQDNAIIATVANKVDKVTGFALSSNDYTSAEKTKLAGIAPGATANSTDAQLLSSAASSAASSSKAASTITGLAAVATSGAYADLTGQPTIPPAYTDAQAQNAVAPALALKAATTYVDSQDNSIIATVATKVDKVTGFALSSNDYTSAEKSKLAGIAPGATANSTDAQLLASAASSAASASKAASTITGLAVVATSGAYADLTNKPTIPPDLTTQVNANTSAITTKVDKVTGFALSSNDYTSAEKTKLAGIAPGATANSTDAQLLASAASSAASSSKAASTITGLAVVATSGVYSDLTGKPTIPPDLTTQVNANTSAITAKVDKVTGFGLSSNDYTSPEKTKLAGIASGATVNSTDAFLLARANQTGTQAAATITGLSPVATSGLFADLTGKIVLAATNTPTGTILTQTINKPSGTFNVAALLSAQLVNNSFVTTASIVHCVIRTADTTATLRNVIPQNGAFVLNLSATPTAEISVGFIVFN